MGSLVRKARTQAIHQSVSELGENKFRSLNRTVRGMFTDDSVL